MVVLLGVGVSLTVMLILLVLLALLRSGRAIFGAV